jgi:hypothetical protein
MKARTRTALTTLVLLAAAAGAGAVAWFGVHLRAEEQARGDASAKRLFDVRPEQVKELAVSSHGAEVRLVRAGDGWRIVAPVAADADPEAVRRLVGRLASIERRSTSAPASTPADELKWYGLAAPRARIAFTRTDGRTDTLALGDDNGFDGAMFVQPTGGTVEVVAGAARQDLDQGLNELRDRRVVVFDEPAVTRIEVDAPKGPYALARAGAGWRLERPIADRADDGAASRVLGTLRHLIAAEVIDHPEADARYGLDRPAYQVRLGLERGAPVAVAFGAAPGAAKDAPLYARREGSSLVFAVPASAIAPIDQDAAALRDLRVLRFEQADVEAVRFEPAAGGAVEVHREPAKDPGAKDGWRITAPRAAAAEAWRVSDVLWALSGLDASSVPEGRAAGLAESGLAPPRETVVLLGRDGRELGRLLVGREAGGKVRVKSGASPRVLEVDAARLAVLPRSADDLEEGRTPAQAAPPQGR